MKTHMPSRGVTLVELLITIAVLTLVLGGIYGLLNSAYRSYSHTQAKLESQQTARIVLDYLVYRLREIDGGASTSDPTQCTKCHGPNMDQALADHPFMPCTTDVSTPHRAPIILDYKKVALPAIADVPAGFQTMTGNYIKFQADLLPLHGFNESFTDSPAGTAFHNDVWDWTAGNANTDLNQNGKYDKGEPELLDDMNNNSQYDYFGETWTLALRASTEGPYYELVESVNFTSLSPRTRKPNGKVLYDNSAYPATGYTNIPVAYGITALSINKVPRELPPYPTGRDVVATCASSSNATACHGSSAATNVYGNATSMNYAQFLTIHPFWNTAGLNLEVTATNTTGGQQQFTRLRAFVNFRNLEINQ